MSHSQPLPGVSRTIIRDRYALIGPDSHVPSVLPGWNQTTAHILISPAMGAGLVQTLLVLADQASGTGNTGEEQHFLFCIGRKLPTERKEPERWPLRMASP